MHQAAVGGGGVGGGCMCILVLRHRHYTRVYIIYIAYALGRDVCIKNVLVDIAHLYIIYE